MTVRILTGDCREQLRTLADGSVHCAVTSPPYFGLRDYGTASWVGGDPACDHKSHEIRTGQGMVALGERYSGGGKKAAEPKPIQYRGTCGRCGALQADSQIGLEQTPDEFVAQLVAVFREVRRVLRDDGTLWLNLGDSYANDTKWGGATGGRHHKAFYENTGVGRGKRTTGLKAKDLIGIPWRVAFALQADGWYLRQDIIWSKPNPMPESVGDRCTKSHEYLFLLTKSPKYFYDAEAIAEPAAYFGLANQDESGFKAPQSFNGKHKDGYRSGGERRRGNAKTFRGGGAYVDGRSFDNSAQVERNSVGNAPNETGTRNKRSVWAVDEEEIEQFRRWKAEQIPQKADVWSVATKPYADAHFATFPPALIEPCIKAGCPEGGTVLDPFGGAGTTGLVADRLRRNAVLIELNPAYAEMARRRIYDDAPLFQEAAQ